MISLCYQINKTVEFASSLTIGGKDSDKKKKKNQLRIYFTLSTTIKPQVNEYMYLAKAPQQTIKLYDTWIRETEKVLGSQSEQININYFSKSNNLMNRCIEPIKPNKKSSISRLKHKVVRWFLCNREKKRTIDIIRTLMSNAFTKLKSSSPHVKYFKV